MDLKNKIDIQVKLFKKDQERFEDILKKYARYPATEREIELRIAEAFIRIQKENAMIYQLKIDLLKVPLFLSEIRPLLHNGMDEWQFYEKKVEIHPQINEERSPHARYSPVFSHGWIVLLGLQEIETVETIDDIIQKTKSAIVDICGKRILGIMGLIAQSAQP